MKKTISSNGHFHRTPTRIIRHKGVDIPVFGPQKNRSFMENVSAKGLRNASILVLTLAGAALLAWISQG